MRELERQVLQFSDITAGRTGDIRSNMPLGIAVTRYKLRFTGTFLMGAAPGALQPDSPFTFLKNLQLQLGGGFPLRNADGRFWKFWNTIQRSGVVPDFVAPSVAGNAQTSISFVTLMDMVQSDLNPPLDRAFVFDTRLVSGVSPVFDWGQATDIATGASSLTSPQMTIVEVDAADVRGAASRVQVSRQQVSSGNIVANSTFDVYIASQGPAYRAIVLSARSGNADPNLGVGDDTIVTAVSLIGDNAVRYYDLAPWTQIQNENKVVYGMINGWPAGWVVLDFAKDRTLRNLLLTQNRKQLVLRLTFASSLPSNPFVNVYPVNDILVVARSQAARGRRAVQVAARAS
jgi:hypothetical protein